MGPSLRETPRRLGDELRIQDFALRCLMDVAWMRSWSRWVTHEAVRVATPPTSEPIKAAVAESKAESIIAVSPQGTNATKRMLKSRRVRGQQMDRLHPR
jgi:hypothetical protein